MTHTGKTLSIISLIFPILFLLMGVFTLFEGETGPGVFWIYVGIATIPEKIISSRMLTAKYLAVILLGVLGLFFEMQMWMHVIMVVGLLVAAIELYRYTKRMSRRLNDEPF